MAGARRGRRPGILVLAVLALVASGCRLAVTTEVDVAADGAADLALQLRLDGSLLAELDRLGVDPTLDVDAALAGDDGWRRDRRIDDDGGLVLRFTRRAADPQELSSLLADLADGVPADAPALELDLAVVPGARGAMTIEGRAGVRPPTTIGARRDGVPVGPAGPALAALVDEVVEATLVMTLPGPVLEHDADRVDGRTLTWELPVGPGRSIRAVGGPAPWWSVLTRVPREAAAALTVLATAAALVVVGRRARARRSGGDGGRGRSGGAPGTDAPAGLSPEG